MPADRFAFVIRSLTDETAEPDVCVLEEASTTIGRHLDNDLVIAGEDVMDYHARAEVTDRGVTLHPLGNATFEVNGVTISQPFALVVDDLIALGQDQLELVNTSEPPIDYVGWMLYRGDDEWPVQERMGVGRNPNSELVIDDDHISRQHARIELRHGELWLRDLESANGSFVNGERLTGGCLLLHGDEVAFDNYSYQVIAQGGDLTPVRRVRAGGSEQAVLRPPPTITSDTTEVAVVADETEAEVWRAESPSNRGFYLLGVSDSVAGQVFTAEFGRMVIGRDPSAQIRIDDPTVSARHAELDVRAEECILTNLMATNGTRVNNSEVDSAYLKDGDSVRLGRVKLVFREVTELAAPGQILQRLQWALLVASVVIGVVLAALLVT